MKSHLKGGTLRKVMVAEIKRCLNKHSGSHSPISAAALELGIAAKTLRQWRGPLDKGGWEELQPNLVEGLEAVLSVKRIKKR